MGAFRITSTNCRKYLVQAKKSEDAKSLIEDAKSLEESGVFSNVLELVTSNVTEIITKSVKIPTIGIVQA